jgi:hypothetical protein
VGAKIRRIGILDDAPMWQPFRQALRELGYVDDATSENLPTEVAARYDDPY